MALINCPECQREISDSAKSCPHCGFPIKKRSSFIRPKKTKTISVNNAEEVTEQIPKPPKETHQEKVPKEKPLNFHHFFHYFTIIGTIISSFSNVLSTIQIMNDYSGEIIDLATVALLFNTIILASALAVFIGFFKFKYYSFVCVYLCLITSSLYSLYKCTLPFLGETLGTFVGTLTFSILVGVYYYKRRHLFNGNKPTEQDADTSTEES